MHYRALRCLPVLLLALAACSHDKPLKAPVIAKLHSIILIQPHGPLDYIVGSKNAPLGFDSNLVNDLSSGKPQPLQPQNPTNLRFRAQMADAKFSLADQLGQSVEQAMRQRGYEVTVVPCPCVKTDELVDNVSAFKGKADAVLDLAIADAGYARSADHPYEPRVDLRIRLTNSSNGAVLYEDSVSYTRSWNPQLFNVVLDPESGYAFDGGDDIVANPARAADGLRSSIPELTRVVIQGLHSPAS
jgi:hypothetical protein